MKRQRHVVHSSLVTKPTIGGVSSGIFGLEIVIAVMMFNFFKVSIMSAICIGLIFFVGHPMFRAAHKEDPLSVQFWLVSALSGQAYYPSKPDINTTPGSPKSSIPKKL